MWRRHKWTVVLLLLVAGTAAAGRAEAPRGDLQQRRLQPAPLGNADAGRTWHTDLSYTATPPRGSLLYAVEVPHNERGEGLGDTLFVSTAAAYEALPEEVKQQLQGLRAIHRAGAKQYAPGSQLAEAVKGLPDVTHPVTGRRAIYVRAGECVGIVGMPDAEALPLIDTRRVRRLSGRAECGSRQ